MFTIQRGVDLSTLDVSYVSSLSWYFLVNFGLRGVFRLILGEDSDLADETKMMQMQVCRTSVHRIYLLQLQVLSRVCTFSCIHICIQYVHLFRLHAFACYCFIVSLMCIEW
jgi:hypothetical protein